jgi:hypothetical protein
MIMDDLPHSGYAKVNNCNMSDCDTPKLSPNVIQVLD